jgi:hypothetical protein
MCFSSWKPGSRISTATATEVSSSTGLGARPGRHPPADVPARAAGRRDRRRARPPAPADLHLAAFGVGVTTAFATTTWLLLFSRMGDPFLSLLSLLYLSCFPASQEREGSSGPGRHGVTCTLLHRPRSTWPGGDPRGLLTSSQRQTWTETRPPFFALL